LEAKAEGKGESRDEAEGTRLKAEGTRLKAEG